VIGYAQAAEPLLCRAGITAEVRDTGVLPLADAVAGFLKAAKKMTRIWDRQTSQGISKWLFVGQSMASVGFIIYSWQLRNWVFLVTNLLMLGTALFGQWIYLRNKTPEARATSCLRLPGPEGRFPEQLPLKEDAHVFGQQNVLV
jgi:MtN3 and saliva related transmembrane protein